MRAVAIGQRAHSGVDFTRDIETQKPWKNTDFQVSDVVFKRGESDGFHFGIGLFAGTRRWDGDGQRLFFQATPNN